MVEVGNPHDNSVLALSMPLCRLNAYRYHTCSIRSPLAPDNGVTGGS